MEGQRDHCGVERHHRQPHRNQRVATLPDDAQQRREEDLEQRHVVVKEIAILQKTVCPAPNHVQMLWLVAVDAIVKYRDDANEDGCRYKKRNAQPFGDD